MEQKQRLALARAVYSNADIYLLDDPLSALDAHVGKAVFEGCIGGGPLRDKTRVFVTNQLQYLPYVDRVVVMDYDEGKLGGCRVKDQGTYTELCARGHDFESLLQQHDVAVPSEAGEKEGAGSAEGLYTEEEKELGYGARAHGHGGVEANLSPVEPSPMMVELPMAVGEVEGPQESTPVVDDISQVKEPEMKRTEGGKKARGLMQAEERITGAVKLNIYTDYLKAVRSPLLLILALISFALSNSTVLFQQGIISWWTSDPMGKRHPISFYMGGVAFMAVLASVFTYLRTYLTVLFGVRASNELHHRALAKVMRAPMRWFDTTPIGQLVQRFSSDLDQVDQQLPGSLAMFLNCLLQIVGKLRARMDVGGRGEMCV